MGSSKKHKDKHDEKKHDKKKHKRDRSRSKDRERDKNRHKPDRHRRDKHDERSPHSEDSASRKRSIPGESDAKRPKISSGLSDDEFDVDKLLDSKLSDNYKTVRPIKRRRENLGVDEDSLEKFATEQMLEEHKGAGSKLHSDARVRQEASSSSKGRVDSLTIAETNKLRAKLGLKPLEVKQEGQEKPKKIETPDEISEANKLRLKLGLKPLDTAGGRQESSRSSDSKRTNESKPATGEESGDFHESLSIAETNKLRIKLGLKPLDTGASNTDTETKAISKQPEEVFVKTENLSDKKKQEALREKLRVAREKRSIEEKLRKTKGLADSDSEDESAVSWISKHRKIQEEKEIAEKRAKMLEEMDAEFGIDALVKEEFDPKKNYSDKHLKGLTVAHDVESFQEGHQVILTLKDKGVLDEEEDVLENVNIVDSEKYAKNVENKLKKPDYKPYDEPEYDEFGILKKKSMLSKYDEEIEGEKKKTFKIGSEGRSFVSKEQELELIRMKLKQQNEVSLEMPEMRRANEYFTPQDMVQFKKPKKKRKIKTTTLKADDLKPDVDETDLGSRRRNARRRVLDEDDFDTSNGIQFLTEGVVNTDIAPPPPVMDPIEKDTDAALGKAKRLKKRFTAASAEEKILELLSGTIGGLSSAGADDPINIEMNSVAEFCRTLGDIPTYGLSGNREDEAEDMMDIEKEPLEEAQNMDLDDQNQGAWNEVDIEEKPAEISMRENEPILEEEPDIIQGVAGALKMAAKKGYLDKDDDMNATAPRSSQLQAKSYTIEEKFYDDDKFGKQRDRYTGPLQDFKEKSNYKPEVNLEYIDDSGRILTSKEAFRYLSHKFHGKGPGKNKVDKRMKKIDQDMKLKQMSSTDTPLNTVKLLQQKQKETQSPYIVLSGGNKTLTQTMISKTKTV